MARRMACKRRTWCTDMHACARALVYPRRRHETLRQKLHLNQAYWFQNAMPWVVPGTFNFASVDFTPNYLCSQVSPLRSKINEPHGRVHRPPSDCTRDGECGATPCVAQLVGRLALMQIHSSAAHHTT